MTLPESNVVSRGKKKLSGSFILLVFLAFFLVLCVVDGTFVYLASHTSNGEVTENAYQKGLQYNKVLAEGHKQKELGWQATLSFEPIADAAAKHMVKVQLLDKDRITVEGAEVIAHVLRPIEGYKQEVLLQAQGSGVYMAEVVLPKKAGHGQWELRVFARRGDADFFHSQRFVLK